MRTELAVACLVAIVMSGTAAHAENCIVTKKIFGCDYFMADAPSGYVVAEWYGGYDPSEGERIVGAFHNYGFITVFYGSSHTEGRVYIEDWGLGEDDAFEQLSDKCN